MKYRRLSSTGDYVFGGGKEDYLTDREAVAQAIKTKLLLLLGEWWEDTEDGLPLFQEILRQRATPDRVRAVDLLIRERMSRVPHVTDVETYVSEVVEGEYRGRYTVQTDFGTVTGEIMQEVI
jgi:hypothetical protein